MRYVCHLLAVGTILGSSVAAEQSAWFRLEAPPRYETTARRVVRILSRSKEYLEPQLGIELTSKVTVKLCPTEEDFRAAAGVESKLTLLAVAVPSRQTIIVNCQREGQWGVNDLQTTLQHELCHILIGEAEKQGGVTVPLWFNEGVAVRTSGRLPFLAYGVLDGAAAAGNLIALADLRAEFPKDPALLTLAYEQSESFLRFLEHRSGPGIVPAILSGVSRGRPFEQAFKDATGLQVPEAENLWIKAITPRWWWVGYIRQFISLFFLMAVLCIIAYIVYRYRRRRKFEEWDEEDRWGWWDRDIPPTGE